MAYAGHHYHPLLSYPNPCSHGISIRSRGRYVSEYVERSVIFHAPSAPNIVSPLDALPVRLPARVSPQSIAIQLVDLLAWGPSCLMAFSGPSHCAPRHGLVLLYSPIAGVFMQDPYKTGRVVMYWIHCLCLVLLELRLTEVGPRCIVPLRIATMAVLELPRPIATVPFAFGSHSRPP